MNEHILHAATSWLMAWPDPVVIADESTLAILSQNRAADKMFAIGPLIQNLGGRLHFSDPRVTEDFRAQLRDYGVDPIAVCVDRDDEECILAARVDHPMPETQPNTVILTFRGRVGGQDVSGGGAAWPSLLRLYDLTHAEERVARLLTTAASVPDMAASLGVSVDTVRSHAQKIYLKVGVANREQLTARLMPIAFPSQHMPAHGGAFEAGYQARG